MAQNEENIIEAIPRDPEIINGSNGPVFKTVAAGVIRISVGRFRQS
jgi:hypothetical protein